MTFAIAHEFGHAFFDFVLKNKLDGELVADLTVHDYIKYWVNQRYIDEKIHEII